MRRPVEKQNVPPFPWFVGKLLKLGAGSHFCSGVTLAPSDELWLILEAQMGLLVPWAHHEIVQRAVEEVRTICTWAQRGSGLGHWW